MVVPNRKALHDSRFTGPTTPILYIPEANLNPFFTVVKSYVTGVTQLCVGFSFVKLGKIN